MSRSGEVTLFFGEAERTFRLPIKGWEKVQEACDAGPAELLARLSPPFQALKRGVPFSEVVASGLLGAWRVEDVRKPIFHGLIGAGVTPAEAHRLVTDWVDERPLLEAVPVAYAIVMASVCGAPDEAASGEQAGARTGPALSPEAS